MNESNGHVFVGIPYQGNAWWSFMAIIMTVAFLNSLLGNWRDRKAGRGIDVQAVMVKSIIFLILVSIPLFQVFSHSW
jgi:hypothetical protein